MKILGIISIASILLLSCKSLNNAERSNLREAPGRGDRPEILGVNADMTWDQIKGNKKNQREIPWTDTYWPLYQMGMAARWVPNDGVLNKTPLTIYESLTQLKAVLDNNDKVAMNALSPAEKYDLMFYGPKENFPEVLKKMETIHKEVVDNPKYTDLKSGIESLHEKMQLEYEQIDELSSQFDEVFERYGNALLEDNESLLNSIQSEIARLEGLYESRENAILDIETQIKSKSLELEMAIAGPQRWLSSMSNEIKKDFPLTVEGWDTWSSNLAQHGDTPWTWMGHCHGWAPASLLEEKPKHSVLARRNGKEILFTEGDIRGLLTKAWSGGKTEGAKFASSRCETNDIPTDENGRVLDGLVCNESQNFDSCQDKKKIYVLGYDLRAYGYGKGHIRYTESKISNDVKIALTESKGQDKYLLDFVEPDGNGGVKRTGKTASMHFTKGCRDTNPMTFHLATIQLIAPGKPGYILDKTRTSEVWNQPAFKYETRTVPVELKNGSISKEDELIPVGSIDDKFEEFRAEGTKYLIQVETTLTYGVENGPFTHYKKDDEHFETDTYNYTLEFDENKKIIGGEWGHIPAGDEYKDQLISAESPDFIWQYSNSTTPMPYDETDIEYKFVSQLHKCSLNSSNLKSGNFDGIGEVKYQECALD